MENQPLPPPATISATTSQPSEKPQSQTHQPPSPQVPSPLPQPQLQPQPTQCLPSSSTGAPPTATTPSLSSQPPTTFTQSSNQNPCSKPFTPLPHLSVVPPLSPVRPTTAFPRNSTPQPSQQPHFPHFSSPLSPLPPASALASISSSSPSPSSSSSSSASSSSASSNGSSVPSSISGQLPPRPDMATGVPAHQPSPSPPFTSSFGQHYGGLGRTGVNATGPASNSTAGQVRTPMQGMGVLGSLGSSSQVQPAGKPSSHQQRPVQPSLRPPTSTTTQATTSQNLQAHGITRAPSVGSSASPSPNASLSMQPHTQPRLSPSVPQGKPPLPTPSYRQQINTQNCQQRSHTPQPHPQQQQPHLMQPQQNLQQHPKQPQPDPQQSMSATSNQQHLTAMQQQYPSSANQALERIGQVPPSRSPQALSHQQQIARVQGGASQKPLVTASQANVPLTSSQSRLANTESNESSTRILSKRSIHELVNQVDPSEALDPEVEEILMDIAEDFVESITKFGCLLAKHRKSPTLEAKDILLHLEKNWNMTLPGFADEIKSYRRQPVSDIHRERLSETKRSVATTDAAHSKNSTGQTAGNAKGSITKTPGNVVGSPNMRNG